LFSGQNGSFQLKYWSVLETLPFCEILDFIWKGNISTIFTFEATLGQEICTIVILKCIIKRWQIL
jgi:hypothetical protein